MKAEISARRFKADTDKVRALLEAAKDRLQHDLTAYDGSLLYRSGVSIVAFRMLCEDALVLEEAALYIITTPYHAIDATTLSAVYDDEGNKLPFIVQKINGVPPTIIPAAEFVLYSGPGVWNDGLIDYDAFKRHMIKYLESIAG